MLNVGLTGGIATGKSTVAKMLVEKGAILIDLDELAHAVEEPEKPAWREIVSRFGEEILQADKRIDRRKLGALVFGDAGKRKLLDSLVHPAVVEEWQRRIDEIRASRPDAVILSDVPLLFEAGLRPMVDLVLLVYASPEDQMRRLALRNGCGREEAERRLAAQMPIADKLPGADFVIYNDGSLENTRRVVDEIWKEFQERERRRRNLPQPLTPAV